MKTKKWRVLIPLIFVVFFLNVSFVADSGSRGSALSELNHVAMMLPFQTTLNVVTEEEVPIDGGDAGEATITCSNSGYGRCYQLQFVFCTYDPFGGYECVFIGYQSYYCSLFLVKLCNFLYI